MANSSEKPKQTAGNVGLKVALLIFIACLVGVGYWQFGDRLSLEYLARQESRLRELEEQNPVLVYAVAFLVYVGITGLSLPGATALSLAYGWYFGFVSGFIMVSFASTSGATLAFLLSRFLFRDAIERRFGERLKGFNEALAREGPFYLFTLRLIPAVPFFVINAVMGLTPIRLRTYWWVSQLGMLPGTAVYIYAGSSVPSLETLAEKGLYSAFTPSQLTQIFIAFALLGIFPLAARGVMKLVARARSRKSDRAADNETAT